MKRLRSLWPLARPRLLAALRLLGANARNLLALGALAAVSVGLWWERPSLALIVPGVFVLGCLVLSHTRGA